MLGGDMAEIALVGDIGGTNSRFGLIESGGTVAQHIGSFKNDDFRSLETVTAHYLAKHGLAKIDALSVAIAGPVTGERIGLTNRDWVFTHASLAAAANAGRAVILNDYEALALSLPHLGPEDVVQIGGETPAEPETKIVLGPGTGLGMATLAPLPGGGWMPVPGELGHASLPIATQEEFDWRQAMTLPGVVFEAEDAITGPGLLRMYRAKAAMLGDKPHVDTPEKVLNAGLTGHDAAAAATLDQFIIWLARLAGDAAMTMQARGGVYLAGGIAPSIVEPLKKGPFREIFQEKGRLAHVMRPIPVYVIVDKFPAFKGCAAALRSPKYS
jgi:glucokinase